MSFHLIPIEKVFRAGALADAAKTNRRIAYAILDQAKEQEQESDALYAEIRELKAIQDTIEGASGQRGKRGKKHHRPE